MWRMLRFMFLLALNLVAKFYVFFSLILMCFSRANCVRVESTWSWIKCGQSCSCDLDETCLTRDSRVANDDKIMFQKEKEKEKTIYSHYFCQTQINEETQKLSLSPNPMANLHLSYSIMCWSLKFSESRSSFYWRKKEKKRKMSHDLCQNIEKGKREHCHSLKNFPF